MQDEVAYTAETLYSNSKFKLLQQQQHIAVGKCNNIVRKPYAKGAYIRSNENMERN